MKKYFCYNMLSNTPVDITALYRFISFLAWFHTVLTIIILEHNLHSTFEEAKIDKNYVGCKMERF